MIISPTNSATPVRATPALPTPALLSPALELLVREQYMPPPCLCYCLNSMLRLVLHLSTCEWVQTMYKYLHHDSRTMVEQGERGWDEGVGAQGAVFYNISVTVDTRAEFISTCVCSGSPVCVCAIFHAPLSLPMVFFFFFSIFSAAYHVLATEALRYRTSQSPHVPYW